ncbi:hypothetical protein DO021_17660 [Desulfobacter hydrogenophilus]|uniref:Uncharacterized protein n=1 Tax=Desulfobacter hydrogenophilus TaxID=2291 RepID=A0A328F7W0_9BACT|nr:hypothetical protein [Desulfobacter hydrogenophilus]NDY73501.1 hypothetical protein [Desulfobacter hydrogenophilus]QBH15724.1 hypothetical protein EYB58_22905 [Desulfobacter hydrogenophilus]RAM00701.1 hypothetical protein DO021_17660 [Desulfobacter hydrogenophilus]
MAQSVIVKKNEKIGQVISSLPVGFTNDQFIDAFIEKFPKEWERIKKVYADHERRTRPGKSHPMPEPKKYLVNSLTNWKKKNSAK